jgi:methyltransferase family protein
MTKVRPPAATTAAGSFVRTLADNSRTDSLATRMRRQRFALFLSLLESVEGPIEILDIGGTQQFWDLMLGKPPAGMRVTLLNVAHQPVSSSAFVSAVGDAKNLGRIGNRQFDVVFSNSVIEHVGDYADQRRMADEVQRVGKRYFVQTPNRRFPIEPHFLFPFFQYLPISTRAWMLSTFDVGWYRRIRDKAAARREVESIQLLTKSRFAKLFPGAAIYEEKVLGLTKSFVAFCGWEAEAVQS